jgi:uncharacterized protein with HEPN domain
MTDEAKKSMLDTKQAVENIFSFVGKEPDFSAYKENLMLRRAVEREFLIMGEAANRLKKEGFGNLLQSQKEIIAYRNFLTHAYDSVVDEKVWAIIVRYLPPLLDEINQLLNSESND